MDCGLFCFVWFLPGLQLCVTFVLISRQDLFYTLSVRTYNRRAIDVNNMQKPRLIADLIRFVGKGQTRPSFLRATVQQNILCLPASHRAGQSKSCPAGPGCIFLNIAHFGFDAIDNLVEKKKKKPETNTWS